MDDTQTSSPNLQSSSPSPVPLGDSGLSAALVRTNNDGIELNKLVELEESANSSIPPLGGEPTLDEFLNHLDESAERVIHLIDLLQSATTSLDIRTMNNTDHSPLKPFKKGINRAVSDYLEAVESTTETAQHGVTFAANIGHLYEILGDQQISNADRNQFMKEVEQIVAKALENAKRTCDELDCVQTRLYDIVESVKRRKQRKEGARTSEQLPGTVDVFQVKIHEIFENSQRLVEWWADMKTTVRMGQDRLITAGNQPMSAPHIDLHKKWEAVSERFQGYNRAIAVLKAQFPRPLERCPLWRYLMIWKEQTWSI